MEIKVNVETNAEEREDVELFEQERKRGKEFKINQKNNDSLPLKMKKRN